MSGAEPIPALTALWLGILTSISPCPLATNLAALTFVSRQLAKPGMVVLSGVFYTVGRVLAYLVIAVVVVSGLFSMPAVSAFLQHHLHRLLGPLLVLVGAVLLGLISLPVPSNHLGVWSMERSQRWGGLSSLLLGFVFALSFCPVSAALFFGTLIPLCLKSTVYHLYPLLFGIGTAVPVVVIAILLGRGVEAAGSWLGKLSQVEKASRVLTAALLVGIGVYLTGSAIFRWW